MLWLAQCSSDRRASAREAPGATATQHPASWLAVVVKGPAPYPNPRHVPQAGADSPCVSVGLLGCASGSVQDSALISREACDCLLVIALIKLGKCPSIIPITLPINA